MVANASFGRLIWGVTLKIRDFQGPNTTILHFFQLGFHPFPLKLTERAGPSYIYNREGLGREGSELEQCQETYCEYSPSSTRYGAKT
jgi:hypothetical protein